MDSSDYIEVSVQISPFSEDLAEVIEATISDCGFDAFMIEDECLKCYIQSSLFIEDDLKLIMSSISENNGCQISFSYEKMPEVNWNATWEQEGFTTIMVDDEVAIVPEGTDTCCSARYEIKLAANMAFGTGHHHTTYMMMQSMLSIEHFIKGKDVTDLGCGTAVLAILAAKMGASYVKAIDIDAVAARSAGENVDRNKVRGNTDVKCGDASLLKENSTDVLLANIHRNIIIGDIDIYSKAVRPGGYLLVSGFYSTDCEDIIDAAHKAGFKPSEESRWSRFRENWACLQFVKQA